MPVGVSNPVGINHSCIRYDIVDYSVATRTAKWTCCMHCRREACLLLIAIYPVHLCIEVCTMQAKHATFTKQLALATGHTSTVKGVQGA